MTCKALTISVFLNHNWQADLTSKPPNSVFFWEPVLQEARLWERRRPAGDTTKLQICLQPHFSKVLWGTFLRFFEVLFWGTLRLFEVLVCTLRDTTKLQVCLQPHFSKVLWGALRYFGPHFYKVLWYGTSLRYFEVLLCSLRDTKSCKFVCSHTFLRWGLSSSDLAFAKYVSTFGQLDCLSVQVLVWIENIKALQWYHRPYFLYRVIFFTGTPPINFKYRQVNLG